LCWNYRCEPPHLLFFFVALFSLLHEGVTLVQVKSGYTIQAMKFLTLNKGQKGSSTLCKEILTSAAESHKHLKPMNLQLIVLSHSNLESSLGTGICSCHWSPYSWVTSPYSGCSIIVPLQANLFLNVFTSLLLS
jgi:hypothetical protein